MLNSSGGPAQDSATLHRVLVRSGFQRNHNSEQSIRGSFNYALSLCSSAETSRNLRSLLMVVCGVDARALRQLLTARIANKGMS